MDISTSQPMIPLHVLAKQMQPDAMLRGKIGISSEATYTKEDAIRNQYNKQFNIDATIDDIVSGRFDTSNIKLASMKQEDIDAYGLQLEAKGLDGKIDWKGVDFDFSSVDVGLDTIDQVSNKAEYIASRYAVLKERINSDYTGDERKDQMAKLEGLYSSAKDLLANSYSKTVGDFFEENGVSGQTDQLRDSVLQGIDKKADEYSDYIKNHSDYAGIADDDNDQWLLKDDGFMAARLRESMTTPTTAKTAGKQADYSLKDLDGAGMYVKQTQEQYDSLDHVGTIRNEESLGLGLAVQSMKVDYLTKHAGFGDKMASLIHRSFEGYTKNYLNKLDSQLKKYADDSFIENSKQLFAPLDHSAIDKVYQHTMEQYRSSGDIMTALTNGATFGKAQYTKKVDRGQYGTMARYQSQTRLKWDNFFTVTDKTPYDINMSDLQKYSLTLNHFKKSVDCGDMKSIDMMLGLGGDISSDRINYQFMEQYAPDFNWQAYA